MGVDDPQTTQRRRFIIQSKPFLKEIYKEWYQQIRENIPGGEGSIFELGSGAGFMKECIPEVITTDVLDVDGVDIKLAEDGKLPVANQSVKAIVMTDVLHHINDPRQFFTEAGRVVRPGGMIIMIEPWVTSWSNLIYRKFHSEPFDPDAEEWEFQRQGPLSGANGALPWIIFERDRKRFEREFPKWIISKIELIMPIAYILSGGVSMRALAPGFLYRPCRAIERALKRFRFNPAMFALCILTRKK